MLSAPPGDFLGRTTKKGHTAGPVAGVAFAGTVLVAKARSLAGKIFIYRRWIPLDSDTVV